jgi:superfamily II DNA helicase RecQ
MVRFVQDNTCRARALLAYFNEPMEADCGQCDVCMQHARAVVHVPESMPPSAVLEPLPDDLRWRLDEE